MSDISGVICWLSISFSLLVHMIRQAFGLNLYSALWANKPVNTLRVVMLRIDQVADILSQLCAPPRVAAWMTCTLQSREYEILRILHKAQSTKHKEDFAILRCFELWV